MFRLAEFLQSRGFKDINYDILTRPDQTEWSDHLNRVSSSLLRTFPERAFLFPVALIHTYLFTLPPLSSPDHLPQLPTCCYVLLSKYLLVLLGMYLLGKYLLVLLGKEVPLAKLKMPWTALQIWKPWHSTLL